MAGTRGWMSASKPRDTAGAPAARGEQEEEIGSHRFPMVAAYGGGKQTDGERE